MFARFFGRRDDRRSRRTRTRRMPRLEALDGRLLLSTLGAASEAGLQCKMTPEIKHGW